MPTLNSFSNSQNYNTQTVNNPLYAAFLAGATYKAPTFVGGVATTNPGGLFGWLIYSRAVVASPAKGLTTDSYIVYANPTAFLNDLNALQNVSKFLISDINSGGTFGLFEKNGTVVTGLTNGIDFLHAWSYLAYGGTIVIAGTTAAFSSYETATGNNIDVLLGQTADASRAKYVFDNPYTIGIFPSNGYTASDFDTFLGTSVVAGSTVTDRYFNIDGSINKTVSTPSLATGTSLTYTLPPVADVAGAFTRSKNTDNFYLTVAGTNFSIPLNGAIVSPIVWENQTAKNIYKKNRVNFYTSSTQGAFLGLDLVGATMGSSSSYTADDRIGVSNLKNNIEKNVTDILLKYVFDVNNSTTRASVTTEVELYIESINEYLDPTGTNVVCDGTNNTDNSSTITVDITVKPIIASSEFVITVSQTAS